MNVLINSSNIELSQKARKEIEHKLLFSFSRFQTHIEKIELNLKDINGPKGGDDKQCVINLKWVKEDGMTISGKADSVSVVVDKCVTRAKSVISRKLKMKKIHRERLSDLDAQEIPLK